MNESLEWLILANLIHLKTKLFSQVSFGKQRLLKFLRIFVKNPNLLILDESYKFCNQKLFGEERLKFVLNGFVKY